MFRNVFILNVKDTASNAGRKENCRQQWNESIKASFESTETEQGIMEYSECEI